MPATQPETAVAFVVREKFAWALASLRRLYALAGAPFTLYLVDGGYPPAVRAGLEAFLAGKQNVVRIETGRFLYSSEALNMVIERMSERYLFLLQNDVLIGRNALALLLESARTLGCEAVAPQVLDTDAGAPAPHRGTSIPVELREEEGRVRLADAPAQPRQDGRSRIELFETHCVLLDARAARALAPLPPLSLHDHIDLCIAFWRLGMKAWLDERVNVLYLDSPPLPLRDYECAFYRFRWDPARARLSDEYVRGKWHVAGLFDPRPYIARQQSALRPEAVLTRYESLFEADPWPEEFPGT